MTGANHEPEQNGPREESIEPVGHSHPVAHDHTHGHGEHHHGNGHRHRHAEDHHPHQGDPHLHDHPHGDHPHPHPHHGDRSRWSRITHGIGQFLGTHSHDHAESTDEALESSSLGMKALKISFGVLMATAVAQAGLVWLTGSVSLLADTIHNFSDALTAVPLFIAFRLGRRSATRKYTYGYSRAEDLAGLFIVLMILLSAIVAIWESVERLRSPRPIEYIGVLFAAGVVGFAGNELVALYRIRIGRRIGSAALVADGQHARVDGLTSLAVAVGAVLVWLGFERADPIVGIIIGVLILRVLWSAGKEIYARMMDAVDPALVDRIEDRAGSVPGVLSVNSCQVRWLGHRLRADISIGVDGSISVGDGHHIGEHVERELYRTVEFLDVIFVHVDCADDPGSALDKHRRPAARSV